MKKINNPKTKLLNMVFSPYDLAHSENWKIKAFWKIITDIWICVKDYPLIEVNENNLQEFLDLCISVIVFSNPKYSNPA